jgi:hypothetical protein
MLCMYVCMYIYICIYTYIVNQVEIFLDTFSRVEPFKKRTLWWSSQVLCTWGEEPLGITRAFRQGDMDQAGMFFLLRVIGCTSALGALLMQSTTRLWGCPQQYWGYLGFRSGFRQSWCDIVDFKDAPVIGRKLFLHANFSSGGNEYRLGEWCQDAGSSYYLVPLTSFPLHLLCPTVSYVHKHGQSCQFLDQPEGLWVALGQRLGRHAVWLSQLCCLQGASQWYLKSKVTQCCWMGCVSAWK